MESKTLMSTSLIGVVLLLIYNILISLKEVITGNVVQTLSPFLLVFLTFTFCGIVFQVIALIKYRDSYFKPFLDFKTLLKVNITTVGAWIGFFYGVKYLEPAIASTLAAGFGPAIATIFFALVRPSETKFHPIEKISSLGILILSIALAYISFSGMSSIKNVDMMGISKGIILTILSSICVVITTYYTKSMSNIGTPPSVIMAHRFYLLTPISLILFLFINRQPIVETISDNFGVIVYISVLGATVPLIFLQYGIKYCPPLVVLTLLSVCPLFTLLFQLGDSRLEFSMFSSALILLMTIISLVSTRVSLKKETIPKQ